MPTIERSFLPKIREKTMWKTVFAENIIDILIPIGWRYWDNSKYKLTSKIIANYLNSIQCCKGNAINSSNQIKNYEFFVSNSV
jgi:predicted negative regulator of RcsB-dependent stress response